MSTSFLQYGLVFLEYAIVLTGLVAPLVAYYSTSYPLLRFFIYNSDALYLPSLYADVLSGDNLAKWSFPPTPYIFPDMVLYFLIRIITPSVHTAMVVFGMIQYLVFALGVMLLAGRLLSRSYGLAPYGLIALMSALFLFLLGKLEFYSQMIFAGTFHFGVVLIIPFVLAISLRLISEPEVRLPLVGALCILSFLTSASDGLYLTKVAVPLVGSWVALFVTKKVRIRHTLVIGISVILSSLIGLVLSLVNILRYSTMGMYVFRPNSIYSSFLKSFNSLVSITQYHAILAAVFLGVCIFVFIKHLVQSSLRKTSTADSKSVLLSSFFSLALIVNTIVIIGLGVFIDRNGFRYFLPFLIFSGFWGIPLVVGIPQAIKPVFVKVVVSCALVGVTIFGLRSMDIQRFSRVFTDVYYPPFVKCMDENTARLGIRNGISQYWQARPISLLTQNNLRVVQVGRDLSPFHWISNLNWYAMEPEFAIIDLAVPENHPFRLDEQLITSRFGKPDATFQCEQSKVIVYRHFDSKFRSLFEKAQ